MAIKRPQQRMIEIRCGCCRDFFTVELGGSAYCLICQSGQCSTCQVNSVKSPKKSGPLDPGT